MRPRVARARAHEQTSSSSLRCAARMVTSHWPSPPGEPTPEEQRAAAKAAQDALDAKRAVAIARLASANLAGKKSIQLGYAQSADVPGGYYKKYTLDRAAGDLARGFFPAVSPEEAERVAALHAKRDANVAAIEEARAVRAFKAEAARIFGLADVDASGELDLNELTAIRNSKEMAEFVLANVDMDASGTISLEEWTRSCMKVYDTTPRGAQMMLQLYEAWIREEPTKQRSTRRERRRREPTVP